MPAGKNLSKDLEEAQFAIQKQSNDIAQLKAEIKNLNDQYKEELTRGGKLKKSGNKVII